MQAGDKALQIVGVEQIATKNMYTVRVRIFLRLSSGKMVYFDADQGVWDMDRFHIANETLGIVNDGFPR